MAITANKLRRLEVWSTWAAAGGIRQAVIDDATTLRATSNLEGSDQLNLTLPLVGPAAPFVVPTAVIRVEESDGVFDEWIIVDGPNDDDAQGFRSVQGLSIRDAIANCELIRRIDSDGTSLLDFESVGLTPAQQIATWVIPALARGGMSWVVSGTITPTKLLDLTFSNDRPLNVLQRIADQTGMELDIQRIVGGYQINIIAAIGSTAPVADLRFDKNLQPGTKRSRSAITSATRVYPFGASEDDRHATMSRATWQVTNIAGLIVTLADPAGGKGPIQYDGQLAGLNGTTAAYLRKPGGTLTAVSASSALNQTVTVASVAALAVNDLVQFRADSAGGDLLWLDSPPDHLLYNGPKVGTVEMSDVPSTNNLLKNAVMRAWPGAPTSPPTNWNTVGGGTTARQSVSPFTKIGGFSIHRIGVGDGDGVISDAVTIFPTALKPYVSGYGGLWVVSGQVRVELVFTTGAGTVVQPLPPDFATNSILGQWEDLGAAGIDANVLGATAVALRVVQHGAPVAEFYLDYGQVTDTPTQMPLAESSGGTRLWQAANEQLRIGAAPLVSYELKIVDLANIDPVTWGADCRIVVGGTVRVTDPRLSIVVTTRVVEVTRDYKVWGDTSVKLSNKFDDITNLVGNSFNPPRGSADVSEGPGIPFFDYSTAKLIPSAGIVLAGNTGTKTTAGAFNEQIYSKDGYTGGAFASVTATNQTGQDALFGLNTDPMTDANYTSIDYCIQIHAPTASIYAYESGGLVFGPLSYAAGDVLAVVYDGTTIRYMQNGTVLRTVSVAANIKFFFDSSFDGVGSKLTNIRFGPMSGSLAALAVRARVTATAPTTVTVRVAVADPVPQGAASATIAYQDLGSGGVSPASGQTVTPASTLTEAAGTFVDFTVTRPAFGSGAGRVTFTATAANRVAAIDAVDVPEIGRDTQSITVRVTRISETASQVVVRVEAITPNTAATATVNYDGGGLTVSPATGGTFAATTSFGTTGHIDYTITRDTQGGTPRRVAFTVTAPGSIDGTDGVDVPPNSNRLSCTLRRSGNSTLNSAVELKIPWDIEDLDNGAFHDNVTNNNRITMPLAGLVWIKVQVDFAGNGTAGIREVFVRDSAANIKSQATLNTNGGNYIAETSIIVPVSAGDWFEIGAAQISGANETLSGGGQTTRLQAIYLF